MNNNNKKFLHRHPHIHKKQAGYIVILTIVLLSALLVSSLSFFERTADSMQMTGYSRDSAESMLFAESAMNLVFGQFQSGALVGDDAVSDNTQQLTNPANMPLPYLFHVSENNPAIDQALPSILQRVADGEARNAGTAVNGSIVNVVSNNLLVENLFTATSQPMVFGVNDGRTGRDNSNRLLDLNITTAAGWTNAIPDEPKIAAVWFELVQNPALAGSVQVYIQVASQVGRSKSYVQRLIGSYPTTLGRRLGGINEAS